MSEAYLHGVEIIELGNAETQSVADGWTTSALATAAALVALTAGQVGQLDFSNSDDSALEGH